MTALTVVAPTDAQLGYIAALCTEKGYPKEMRAGAYRPPEWADALDEDELLRRNHARAESGPVAD